MTFKLIAAANVRKTLAQAVEIKRNATISALFHGMISSNVSWATEMRREDAADFDVVLRTMLPIKFDKENQRYQFDNNKAFKSADKLEIELETVRLDYKNADKAGREVIVQAFYDSCMVYYAATEQEAKANSLDADQLRLNALASVKRSLKAAKEKGVSDADLVSLLISQGVDVRAVLNAAVVPVESDKVASVA